MQELQTYYLTTILLAYITAVILKLIIYWIKTKKLNFSYGFTNGGMPSIHTSSITSITFAIGIAEGLTSTFFVAAVLSSIIMSDAVKVRKQLGDQGDALNTLLSKNKLKIVHGHTSKQVLAGLLVGLTVAVITGFIFQLW